MVQPVAKQSRKRGGAGRVVLIVLGAVGIVAGLLLWLLAGSRYDDAVQSLAPAPVACETTLEFDDTGTYLFFVETKGDVGEIEGSCAATDRDYDYERRRAAAGEPDASSTTAARRSTSTGSSEPSYDRGGRAGTAVRTAEIDDAGTYLLTVEANDPDVMIRVGKDPQQGVGAMRVSGIVLAVLGLVALIVGLVLGRRKPAVTTPSGAPPYWQPGGGPPPVAPPYAHQPVAPPFTPGPRPGPSWGAPGAPPPPPPWRLVPAASARPLRSPSAIWRRRSREPGTAPDRSLEPAPRSWASERSEPAHHGDDAAVELDVGLVEDHRLERRVGRRRGSPCRAGGSTASPWPRRRGCRRRRCRPRWPPAAARR